MPASPIRTQPARVDLCKPEKGARAVHNFVRMVPVNGIARTVCYSPFALVEAAGCICMKVSGSRDGVDAGRPCGSRTLASVPLGFRV